jgi:Protein of unknown function (DUF2795)
VSFQQAAELQVVLECFALPAQKRELVEYARQEDESAARRLESLPERDYRSLDEVGEALAPVQPGRPQPDEQVPHEESDAPPGGDAYLDPNPQPGAVRPDAPPWNTPDKQLQQQTEAQRRQQRRQEQLG